MIALVPALWLFLWMTVHSQIPWVLRGERFLFLGTGNTRASCCNTPPGHFILKTRVRRSRKGRKLYSYTVTINYCECNNQTHLLACWFAESVVEIYGAISAWRNCTKGAKCTESTPEHLFSWKGSTSSPLVFLGHSGGHTATWYIGITPPKV